MVTALLSADGVMQLNIMMPSAATILSWIKWHSVDLNVYHFIISWAFDKLMWGDAD